MPTKERNARIRLTQYPSCLFEHNKEALRQQSWDVPEVVNYTRDIASWTSSSRLFRKSSAHPALHSRNPTEAKMGPYSDPKGPQKTTKRKEPPSASADNSAWRNKRQKIQRDARTIAVQTTSKAFKNGELDVGTFVKAREYEIKALEEGLMRSKKALTQRAFQQVPKELRRRTASHNAKKVPKKLRKQAVREVSRYCHCEDRPRKPRLKQFRWLMTTRQPSHHEGGSLLDTCGSAWTP